MMRRRLRNYALVRCDLYRGDHEFNRLSLFEQWFAFRLLIAPAEHLDGSLTLDIDKWAAECIANGEPSDPAMIRLAFYGLLVGGWLEVRGDRVYLSEQIGLRPAGPFSLAKIERSKLTQRMRDEVVRRCAGTCQGCGDEDGPFHIDHVHPISKGGLTVFENLTLLCAPCNLLKRDGSWAEFLERLEERR